MGKIFLALEEGEIEITALSKAKLREIREKYISMIFQGFALFPHRTVLSNITFSLEIQGIDKAERKRRAKAMLDTVKLSGWEKAYPSQLSGGMQQRVGLARALVTGAPVVLMDEAFSALDPLIRVNMQDELLKLQETFKRTNLFVTHDLDEALRLGDRIAIMEKGRFVQVGTPENIITCPKTEYVERFVENADPTNVLTVRTIFTPLEKLHSPKNDVYQLVGSDQVLVDTEGRPTKAIIDNAPKEVVFYDQPESEVAKEFILAVNEDTPMRKVMEFRMKSGGECYTSMPILTVNNDGLLSGIITERNILHGLLEKGRQKDSEKL
jgi:glycine betaine/proline transport system ATP-binding protein